MEKTRITVAVPGAQAAAKIKYVLQRSGYGVADVCSSSSETLRRVRTNPPDILLINFDMPDMTGLEAARIVGSENLCSVILLVSSAQKELCYGQTIDYDITMFQKPVNRVGLLSVIDTVTQGRRHLSKLNTELLALKKGMEERKVIERAKGILMKHRGISEGEAYRRIQKMSMDSRVSMKDIAARILEMSNE